jgi:hypothetical protein
MDCIKALRRKAGDTSFLRTSEDPDWEIMDHLTGFPNFKTCVRPTGGFPLIFGHPHALF